jgi:hypothetical protein
LPAIAHDGIVHHMVVRRRKDQIRSVQLRSIVLLCDALSFRGKIADNMWRYASNALPSRAQYPPGLARCHPAAANDHHQAVGYIQQQRISMAHESMLPLDEA